MTERGPELVQGLPEPLPAGERLLWQGSPSWRALAVRALHARKVAIYFVLLAAWDVFDKAQGGAGWLASLRGAAWLVILGAVATGVLVLLARAIARSTVYTITSARVVLRFGVALRIDMNLPFRRIESAGALRHRDGTTDLVMALAPGESVGYLVTWPHVRPWHFFNAQPAMRALADGDRASSVLAAALEASNTAPGNAPSTAGPSSPAAIVAA